jgi:hypothetical protein
VTETIGFNDQAQRMLAALSPVLVTGPEFLAGRVDADDMAHTMVRAVEEYASGEQARQEPSAAPDRATLDKDSPSASARWTVPQLEAVLAEIYGCGSGYLAHRCDSACVARTMVQIVDEFGDRAASR